MTNLEIYIGEIIRESRPYDLIMYRLDRSSKGWWYLKFDLRIMCENI